MAAVDAQFYFKIPKKLKREFLKVVKHRDIPASQVLRELIRNYVEQNSKNLKG